MKFCPHEKGVSAFYQVFCCDLLGVARVVIIVFGMAFTIASLVEKARIARQGDSRKFFVCNVRFFMGSL